MGGREGLRKLGFAADDIFFRLAGSAEDKKLHVCCQLEAQNKTFIYDCGLAEKTAAYLAIVGAIGDGSILDATLDRIYDESEFYTDSMRVLLALHAKGFRFPVVDRRRMN